MPEAVPVHPLLLGDGEEIVVDKDPLNSTNQAANTFWNRIAKSFSSSMKHTTQNMISIKSQWQTIQHAVNKFSGCMKQIETANQSGTTIEDWFSPPLKLYEALSNKAFIHIQCYNILSQSA
jgi:hypothetical protein